MLGLKHWFVLYQNLFSMVSFMVLIASYTNNFQISFYNLDLSHELHIYISNWLCNLITWMLNRDVNRNLFRSKTDLDLPHNPASFPRFPISGRSNSLSSSRQKTQRSSLLCSLCSPTHASAHALNTTCKEYPEVYPSRHSHRPPCQLHLSLQQFHCCSLTSISVSCVR